MKLMETETRVQTKGTLSSQEYSLEMNSKMAIILSDGLYANKVQAIVRELSTNAIESHAEANNIDKPFEVRLPTRNFPYFEIRDFGAGMTPELIRDIYTHYGKSTKDNVNQINGVNVNGCLGLGSKSPFSYNTRTFHVHSYLDGVERIYACYYNSAGKPSLDHLADNDTDEPNGLKVVFAVKNGWDGDVDEFEEATQRVYQYFERKPVVYYGESDRKFNVKDIQSKIGGTGWRLRDQDYTGSGCRAVMGDVAYPVDSEHPAFSGIHRQIINSDIDLMLEMGDLDIQPSREGLQYNPRTIQHLKTKLENVAKEAAANVYDAIEQCDNLWEARITFVELRKNLPQDLFRLIDWKKIAFDGHNLFDDRMGYVTPDIATCQTMDSRSFKCERWTTTVKESVRSQYKVERDIVIYENDLKTGAKVRCKSIAKQKQDKDIYLVKFSNDEARDRFCESLGFDKSVIKLVSTIPWTVNRGGGGGGSRKTHKVMRYNNYSGSKISFCWDETEVDIKDGGIYVEFNRYKIRDQIGLLTHPSHIRSITRLLERLGVEVPVVYGIKTANIKQAEKHGWIEFYDWVETQIMEFKEQMTVSPAQVLHDDFASRSFGRVRGRHVLQKLIDGGLDNEHPVVKLVERANAIEVDARDVSHVNTMKSLCTIFDIKLDESYVDRGLDKAENDLYKTFPLLRKFDVYCPVETEHMIQYLTLVEKGEIR